MLKHLRLIGIAAGLLAGGAFLARAQSARRRPATARAAARLVACRQVALLALALAAVAPPALAQMIDSFVQVPPDGSGKKLDTSQKTVGGNTVHDQRYNICDPINDVCALVLGPGGALFTSSNDTAAKSNATITSSGSAIIFVGSATEVDVTTNIKASPTGTSPTLTIAVQDVDPGDQATVINSALTGAALNSITTQQLAYSSSSSWVKVAWTVGGTSPSFTQTYITLTAKTETTTTKGVQPLGFVPVQAASDSGRTRVVLHAENQTGVTTEALFTFTKNVNGAETTGQTSYTVTAGKTLRCQSLSILVKDTTTTANNIQVRVRSAPSGISASSPVEAALFASAPAAVASAVGAAALNWDGGIEIAGGNQVAVSHIENVTTASISSFDLTCFEY